MPGFCPTHGPHDATFCPYCPQPQAGAAPQRPGAPSPLDDLTTDVGSRTASTMPPGGARGGGRGFNVDEGATELPASRRGGRGILDYGAEESTELPRSARRGGDDMTELVDPPSVTLGLLWVREGPRKGRSYPIKPGMVIGRKEGDLILDDPKVSSQHAKFTMENENFVIWDFGSANGTFVNDKKIREATILEENDTIKIGETLFVIKFLEPKTKK